MFEIGRQFRNAGIDMTHNPEFTTCEFYQVRPGFAGVVSRVLGDVLVGTSTGQTMLETVWRS